MAECTFLTNHTLVLLCVAREPGITISDLADCVGVGERAAHRLVCELEEGGYLTRQRIGRRNFYEVHHDAPIRHPLARGHEVGELLGVLLGKPRSGSEAA